MFSKTRILSLIGGCIVILLILTGCQPGNSNQEIAMGTDGVPEEIVEAVVAGETIGAAQLTVEQQTIDQAFIEQKQPTASYPEEESVPKILLIDEMADWNDLTYTRLIEIAASIGVQVDLFDGHHFIIDDSYDGIIIFGGGGGNRKKEYIYGGPWKASFEIYRVLRMAVEGLYFLHYQGWQLLMTHSAGGLV